MSEKSITDIIRQRFSCRAYAKKPLDPATRARLTEYIAALENPPFGTPMRFVLAASDPDDQQALKDLGTYGFIRDASAYFIGALPPGDKNLEDYGYQMERLILFATELGLGTCWLGGTFTQSSFAARISAAAPEIVPAVTAVGDIKNDAEARQGLLRRQVGGERRLEWEKLFFVDGFSSPLTPESAGEYATPLEMVRLGPSASNKQPWRVVQSGGNWHFYLQRTPGYRDGLAQRFLKVTDIQRLDMGIAMCHFELTACELGLRGGWRIHEPGLPKPDALTEYSVSWVCNQEQR
jgi:nitroreductase